MDFGILGITIIVVIAIVVSRINKIKRNEQKIYTKASQDGYNKCLDDHGF